MVKNKLENHFARVILYHPTEVFHRGKKYIASWAELYRSHEHIHRKPLPAILVVNDEHGVYLGGTFPATERIIKHEAAAQRRRQIREELEIFGPISDSETISYLLQRIWAGEWMGQTGAGKSIHVRELYELLGVDRETFQGILRSLRERGAVLKQEEPGRGYIYPPGSHLG